jgi:hypothetical protein
MRIDWEKVKEIVVKAAFAGLYAAVAELAITQMLTKDTLLVALGAAGLRGLVVFINVLYEAMKPKPLEARLERKLSWAKCL